MALVFSAPRKVTRGDVAELDDVRRMQLERAAAGSFRAMTFEESLAHVESNDGYWEYLRGTRGRDAIYDLWIMGGDCGRVFEADTVKPTGITIVQSTFKSSPSSAHPLAEIRAAYVDVISRKSRG